METYAAVDLHASTNYTAVINGHDQRPYGKRLPNILDTILLALEPSKEPLLIRDCAKHGKIRLHKNER